MDQTQTNDPPLAFCLPSRPGSGPGDDLPVFLSAHRDRGICLQAGALRRIDLPLLQCLLVAARDWQSRGLGFSLTEVPGPITAWLGLLGITQDHLPHEAAT